MHAQHDQLALGRMCARFAAPAASRRPRLRDRTSALAPAFARVAMAQRLVAPARAVTSQTYWYITRKLLAAPTTRGIASDTSTGSVRNNAVLDDVKQSLLRRHFCWLYGKRERFGVGGLDLVALGDELELLRIAHLDVDRPLRTA